MQNQTASQNLEPQSSSNPKIIFVFKIKNNFFEKLFSSCPLYKIIKSGDWQNQESKLPLKYEYLYSDNAPNNLEQSRLPIILVVQTGKQDTVVATSEDIKNCKGNALSLLGLIQQNLQIYS